MSWSSIEARWQYVKADAKAEWGRLNDMDLQVIGGKREVLILRIADRYGARKESVESDVDEWAKRMAAKIAAMDHPHGGG